MREQWSRMCNLNCCENHSTSQRNNFPGSSRLNQVDEKQDQQLQYRAYAELEMENMGVVHNSAAVTPVAQSRDSSHLENKLPLLNGQETAV